MGCAVSGLIIKIKLKNRIAFLESIKERAGNEQDTVLIDIAINYAKKYPFEPINIELH
jgi:hypothetical protein